MHLIVDGALGSPERAVIESPAPKPDAVLAILEPIRRYWRGRTDRLEPLRAQDILGELRDAFEFFRRPFPSHAVALAERNREVVAPWLVQVLDEVARDPGDALQDDYVLHDFAMVLLGHWRDTRAYRLLLALCRLPYETIEEIFGDLLFETYPRTVASVCDGDLTPLVAMVEDEATHTWVRSALIDAWALRVIEGDAAPGPLEDCLLAIGERDAARLRGLPASSGRPTIIEAVVHAAADIASERLRGPVITKTRYGLHQEPLRQRGPSCATRPGSGATIPVRAAAGASTRSATARPEPLANDGLAARWHRRAGTWRHHHIEAIRSRRMQRLFTSAATLDPASRRLPRAPACPVCTR